MIIRTQAYARIGFMGNPSDGYYGKTISSAVKNFSAQATLWESPNLQVVPNRAYDPIEFLSLNDLENAFKDGYYGGLRLIFATCKKFNEYCRKSGIKLDYSRNFTISYQTDIPRQVGLGGSSAIICATLKALMKFYALDYSHIPKPVLPNLILSVETEELNIPAGLQDRVIQVYGGTVFMDFSKEIMQRYGHGNYEYIDSNLMPALFLVYSDQRSESGKIHSDVRYRYSSGDPEVVEAMRTFASYAEQVKEALLRRHNEVIEELMNKNFDLRRKIYGDQVIGDQNLRMIQIARGLGLPSKFAGSGGAVIGTYKSQAEFEALKRAYKEAGFECVKAIIDEGDE